MTHEQIASMTVPSQGVAAVVAAMGAAGNPAQLLKGSRGLGNTGMQQREDAGVGGSPAVGTAAAEEAAGIAGFATGTAVAAVPGGMVAPIDMVGVKADAAAGAAASGTVVAALDVGGTGGAASGTSAAAAMPPPSHHVHEVVSYKLNDTDDVEVAAEQVMELCSNMEVGKKLSLQGLLVMRGQGVGNESVFGCGSGLGLR